MMFDPSKPLPTLTEKAIHHVKSLMEKSDSDAMGLRVGSIKTAGCFWASICC